MAKLLDELRKAIEESGESRYRIAQDSGVSASQLARFVSGERGLSVETAERLAEYFGLEVVVRKKRQPTRRGK